MIRSFGHLDLSELLSEKQVTIFSIILWQAKSVRIDHCSFLHITHSKNRGAWELVFFFPLPLHCISSFLICHSTWSPRTGFEMNILKFQPSKLILSRFYSASCLSEIFDSDWSFVAFCTQIFSLCLLLLIPVVWVLVWLLSKSGFLVLFLLHFYLHNKIISTQYFMSMFLLFFIG